MFYSCCKYIGKIFQLNIHTLIVESYHFGNGFFKHFTTLQKNSPDDKRTLIYDQWKFKRE